MDNEKRIALLKLGFFPVTDDFWAGAQMPKLIGGGWNWAIRTPYMCQPFMPFHESYLAGLSLEQAANIAQRNLVLK